MEYVGLRGSISFSGPQVCDTDTHCNYLRRSMEDNIVHSNVHLIQESIVNEVAPFGFLVKQTSLREEVF